MSFWRPSVRPKQRVRATRFPFALAIGACMAVVGCGGEPQPASSSSSTSTKVDEPAPATLVVFAAASLRESFDDLAKLIEAEHPGLEVQANYAGSQVLRTQLEQGAAADVLATAALKDMEPLIAANRVEAPQPLAGNELVIAVRKGASVPRSLQELPKAGRIVLGSPEVPVGRYARSML